jgi:hypothetical protein
MMEPDAERVGRAYKGLRRLTADDPENGNVREWVPAWSSHVLEKTIEEILSQPGSRIGDVFYALWDLGGKDDVALTKTMAALIRDIVVLCFTRYRTKYDAEDFQWMADRVQQGAAPAQAYLALLALPESLASASRDAIVESLEGTEFHDEAQGML